LVEAVCLKPLSVKILSLDDMQMSNDRRVERPAAVPSPQRRDVRQYGSLKRLLKRLLKRFL